MLHQRVVPLLSSDTEPTDISQNHYGGEHTDDVSSPFGQGFGLIRFRSTGNMNIVNIVLTLLLLHFDMIHLASRLV